MNIFIDIGHPAHVHYYKNFIAEMKKRGHKVLVTARDRECIHQLLKAEKIEYKNRGKGASTLLGKILYTLKADLIILWHAVRFRPNIFLSHGSHYTMHVSKILGVPCIATGDSDHIKMNAKFLMPFLSCLITPSVYKLNYGKKHVRFDGYMELFHLHHKYFKHDDVVTRNELGLKKDEKYFLLRFVSWNAFHDTNQGGLTIGTKYKLVELLSNHGKVLISSEKELPESLLKYKASFPPEKLHEVIAGAELCISEGATTASEAAILGTPSFYINSLEVSNCTEQEEKYGLCYNYRTDEGLIEKVQTVLATNDIKKKHQDRKIKMQKDKIDPTAFLVWFVENYPHSLEKIQKDPNFQNQFK